LADLASAIEYGHARGVRLEASGGLTLDRARPVAETGVDYISIGALTHSAAVLDIGCDVRS
jgi:nicotinate-nucleotide pyrophosphorylase (carboxylating)